MRPTEKTSPRDVAEEMLTMVGAGAYRIEGDSDLFRVSVASSEIRFGNAPDTLENAFEQLASAIEAQIAYSRVQAMLAAAGEDGSRLPLWIVSGSDVLAKWLKWSGAGKALSRALTLTDRMGAAPIAGELDRRARRELGHDAAKIRVLGGMAVAQRIEISDRPCCIAMMGEKALLRIEGVTLPETLLGKILSDDPRRNDRPAITEVVDHPFLAMADLRLTDVRNEAGAVVIDIASRWTTLAPVPSAVLAVVPRDADLSFPWRATAREITELDRLVEKGRGHRSARD